MRGFVVFLFLVVSFVASENYGSSDSTITPEDIELILVNDFSEKSLRYNLKNAVNILKDPNFKSDKETAFFAFDFNEDSNSISTSVISEAFAERGDQNLIILDYGKFSGGNFFFDALPNSVKVARLFANALIELNQQGMKHIHLIGYSLGAHLMGEAGRTVQKLTNNAMRIQKITGLDPSGPGYSPLNPYVVALNRNDAEFVQIIHTDSINFGISIPTGHADFFPNGGKEQPNCPTFDKIDILKPENQCSHIRSVFLFSESVRHKNASTFHAVTCDTWENFTNYKCFDYQPKLVNHMGINADTKLLGNYFLQTNGKPDFSKDKQGVIYNNNPYVVTPFLTYVN